ncbi:MAG: dihydrolipoyl dehydrogenase [Oscillospiraceae bacterium]|nr:dihydrolipoyl dehydrogenase [Oscillospiraceae bacterium]
MNDYQLIVIGAGPGGYSAALRAAQLGMKTAVVESQEAGGTCLNRGCVPAKTLLHASDVYHSAVHSGDIGVHIQGARVDMGEIFAYKRHVSETLAAGVENLLKSARVPLLRGRGRITGPHTVQVTGADGAAASYTGDNILIATGSVPARPPIPGLELEGVMTSDELLEGTDHLYRSIVIIGGGVIGVEFATFYADLGCEVTIIEGLDRLLPTLDRELGQNLAMGMKRQGVQVFTNATVERVERAEDGLRVCFDARGKSGDVTGEAVLCAIGRRPYYEGLFAEDIRPETDGRSLRVDSRFQTSIPGVYAVGDVSSRYQLAHVAAAQGTACVEMLCGVENVTDLDLVPSCIYCRPEIATVGLTEAEAKAAGIPVKVGKCVMGGNARTLLAEAGRSFMKLVANAETGQLLGAHLMCLNSTDMISQLSGAIADRLTARQLLHTMRPHPTYEEALTDALHDLCGKLEKK